MDGDKLTADMVKEAAELAKSGAVKPFCGAYRLIRTNYGTWLANQLKIANEKSK